MLDAGFGKVDEGRIAPKGLKAVELPKFGLEDVLIAGDFDFAKYAPLLTTIKQVPETETAIKKMLYMSGCLEVRNSAAFSIGVGLK